MKLSIALLGLMFVMASSVPVPGEESIDLVKVPLSGNKVSLKISCDNFISRQ